MAIHIVAQSDMCATSTNRLNDSRGHGYMGTKDGLPSNDPGIYRVGPLKARRRSKGTTWEQFGNSEVRESAPTSLAWSAQEKAVINAAMAIIEGRLRPPGMSITHPRMVGDYLVMAFAEEVVERFGVMFLDSQNQLITFEHLFNGTLTQTAVYPREVTRRALELNAAAVILAHNHPSGVLIPSRADEALTQTLKASLALIDVRVVDHIIVGAGRMLSMAERGLV
jgi:DNA repair protein RadC